MAAVLLYFVLFLCHDMQVIILMPVVFIGLVLFREQMYWQIEKLDLSECCYNFKLQLNVRLSLQSIYCINQLLQYLEEIDYNLLNLSRLKYAPLLFCLCDDQCKCWPGFQLKDDGKTCVDVDECSSSLPCSQRCINTYGSFKCLCVEGYEAPERNSNTCKALSGKAIHMSWQQACTIIYCSPLD